MCKAEAQCITNLAALVGECCWGICFRRHVSSIQDIISRLPPMYSYDANVTHPSSASSSIGEASASDGESVESCDEGDCVDETRERKQQ